MRLNARPSARSLSTVLRNYGDVSSAGHATRPSALASSFARKGSQIRPSEGPLKRPRRLLIPPLKAEEAVFELTERCEVVWRDDLSLNDREVDLDLVEPAGMNRRVHERRGGPLGAEAGGGLIAAVRRTTVHHPEDSPRRAVGLGAHHLSDETVYSRDGRFRFAAAKQLCAMHVPRRQVRQRAHPEVLVFDAQGATRTWSERGMLAAARLDTGFFVCRHHEFVCTQCGPFPGFRIQIEDATGLMGKVRIAGKDPAAVAPRLQSVRIQPAPEGHTTDLRHDAASDDLAPQFRNREARQGHIEPAGQLTGQALNLDDDAGGKSGLGARLEAAPRGQPIALGRSAGAIC